ncbi:MAG: hypothetical protein COV29_04550 [Candidatus Yanofskybacteria bacterium CG10_big_fil_rev_8_21_14_0_10_36_16]|uniref:Apolipoprotein N-acyltransferase n=1 Tax=Candidatus Yanofskybacteria bacterium CG10_big_fil_rev_8_21_14_0_10_36_16 TaxID=1975096 RepID=A0A2J0QA44_9BACT|nr:MAG: hypothetical protein COV29_04550 [Candidatus Yanofskybacteria bacterium CG10_big_fil_rev_8_21_14_0_10_36_16]
MDFKHKIKLISPKDSGKKYLLASISGLLLSLSYPGWEVDLGFLVWIGFVPLFFALFSQDNEGLLHDILHNKTKKHLRKLFSIGFVAGFIYFLIIFRWFFSIHPITDLGIENELLSLVLVYLVYIVSSFGMALLWGVFAASSVWLRNFLPNNKKYLFNFLLIPSILVLTEYIRAWWFGILWYGPGTLLGPHWTIGNLAYALSDNSLALWLSSYLGIYGVLFLIISVNILIYLVLIKEITPSFIFRIKKILTPGAKEKGINLRIFSIALSIIVLTFVPKLIEKINFNFEKSTPHHINYAIIQTQHQSEDLTAEENLKKFKKQLELLKKISQEHPETDIILMPEGSNFSKNLQKFQTPEQVFDFYSRLFKKPALVIDNSRVVDQFGRQLSRVIVTNTNKGALGHYDKRFLTPGGEFLPYHVQLLIRIFNPNSLINFISDRGFSIGENPSSSIGSDNGYNIKPIVCSDLLSPNIVKNASKNSDILTVLTSTSIFNGNPTIINQNLAIAKFRASELKKPLILSANEGFSYAISSNGKIQNITKNQDQELLTGGVALKTKNSWYNKYGDKPILLFTVLLLSTTVLVFKFKMLAD